jgi:hypothetical protein
MWKRIEQDAINSVHENNSTPKNSVPQSTRASSPERKSGVLLGPDDTSWDVPAIVPGWAFRGVDICIVLLCYVGWYRLGYLLHIPICFVGLFLLERNKDECPQEASDFYNMTFPLAKWVMPALTMFIIPMVTNLIRVNWFPTAATLHVIKEHGMAFAVFEPIARLLQDTLRCFTVLSMIALLLIGFVYCLSRVSEGINTGYGGKISVGELSQYLLLCVLAVAVIAPCVLSTPAPVNIRNVTFLQNCGKEELKFFDANVSQCMKVTPAGKAYEEVFGIKILDADFTRTSKIGNLRTSYDQRSTNGAKGKWKNSDELVTAELEAAHKRTHRLGEFARCKVSYSYIYGTRPHDVLTHAMGWMTRLLSRMATQTQYHFAIETAQEVAQQIAFEKARSSLGFTKPDASETGIGLNKGGIPRSPCEISSEGEWRGDEGFEECAERDPVLQTVEDTAQGTDVARLSTLCSALCCFFFFRISLTTVALSCCETQKPSGLIDYLCFGLGTGYVTFHFLSIALYWMIAMQLATIVWSPSKCLDLCFALALRLWLPTAVTSIQTLWGCITSALQATDKTKKNKKETTNKKKKKINQGTK